VGEYKRSHLGVNNQHALGSTTKQKRVMFISNRPNRPSIGQIMVGKAKVRPLIICETKRSRENINKITFSMKNERPAVGDAIIYFITNHLIIRRRSLNSKASKHNKAPSYQEDNL
jgi:hypothetical protein